MLVLEIRPPTDYTHLLHGLGALWPSYLWANHHVMFDHIRAVDRLVLLLNTLLLMVVAFLPFATSVLAGAPRSGHGQRTAVVSYGIAFDRVVDERRGECGAEAVPARVLERADVVEAARSRLE